MTYGKERCRCGHPSCRTWWLTGIGSFFQGSGFSEEEADHILRALEQAEETYVDRNSTVWTRPTAWAYFAACRTLHHRRAMSEALKVAAHPFAVFAERLKGFPIDTPITNGSTLAGQQLKVIDFMELLVAIENLDRPVPADLDNDWDLKQYGHVQQPPDDYVGGEGDDHAPG